MSELTERDIFSLLELFEGSDMTVLHVRAGDFELLLSRNAEATGFGDADPGGGAGLQQPTATPDVVPAPAPADAAPEVSDAPTAASPGVATGGLGAVEEALVVTAPSLGAFYHAPRPDLPPYVAVGSHVEPETTVGLIEAMKVFTAVAAGVQGIVAEFLVANNEFVEYGQPLIRITPDSGRPIDAP